MTDEIERYDMTYVGWEEAEMLVEDTGEYVKYADHIAAMQSKDAEIAELLKDVTFLQSGKDVIRDELQAENERLREALSLIAVMGYSDDPKVAANIARMAVDQSRAALQRKAEE